MRKGSLMNRHRVINNEEETKKGERDESEIERLSKNQWETINSKNEREREIANRKNGNEMNDKEIDSKEK